MSSDNIYNYIIDDIYNYIIDEIKKIKQSHQN